MGGEGGYLKKDSWFHLGNGGFPCGGQGGGAKENHQIAPKPGPNLGLIILEKEKKGDTLKEPNITELKRRTE